MRHNALRDLTLIKKTVAQFAGTGRFLIGYSNDQKEINTSPNKEDLPLIVSTFKVAITDVNPRIPWVLLAYPVRSVEHTLEIDMLVQVKMQHKSYLQNKLHVLGETAVLISVVRT